MRAVMHDVYGIAKALNYIGPIEMRDSQSA